jgi:hypothetical protein
MNLFERIKISLDEAKVLGLDPGTAGAISADKTLGVSILFFYNAPEIFYQGNWSISVSETLIQFKHPTYATTFIFRAN